jgi:hypothetical protein
MTATKQLVPVGVLRILALAALACSPDRITSSHDASGKVTVPSSTRQSSPEPRFVITPADPPFYARVERPYVAPHNDDIAAIIFYRSPGCVPPQFNLLDFFDVPAAFGCAMESKGHEWRFGDASPFSAPYLSVMLQDGPVPIWFVKTSELLAAASDDVLTITEIAALPSLITGSANHWSEWLEPYPTRSPSITRQSATGTIAGGQRFAMDYEERDFAILRFDVRFF